MFPMSSLANSVPSETRLTDLFASPHEHVDVAAVKRGTPGENIIPGQRLAHDREGCQVGLADIGLGDGDRFRPPCQQATQFGGWIDPMAFASSAALR